MSKCLLTGSTEKALALKLLKQIFQFSINTVRADTIINNLPIGEEAENHAMIVVNGKRPELNQFALEFMYIQNW